MAFQPQEGHKEGAEKVQCSLAWLEYTEGEVKAARAGQDLTREALNFGSGT
jgi:hypothetical protein